MKKPPYSLVKLRIAEWTGAEPAVGDELVTAAGSRYQILRIKGKTHHCLTLPPDATVEGPQHCLYWLPRKRRT